MSGPATTRLSTKGQVVIPEEIRDRLGLKAGDQFIVVGEKDVVILRTLKAPSMSEFDDMIREARGKAYKTGMKRTDINSARSKARKNK